MDLRGDMNYKMETSEMVAGLLEAASYGRKMYEHFNFYWSQFDSDSDSCVTFPEWEIQIKKTYIITWEEITTYWITYYWTVYQITEYWWWKYKTADGGFDWEGFRRRVPDGPAFGGSDFFYQDSDGNLDQVWMWFMDDQCYFSLTDYGVTNPALSGECSIPGHATMGYPENITDIYWNFNNEPEYTLDFMFQLGDWGPVEDQTDERYYDASDDQWLWMKPEQHCDPCLADPVGFPDASEWGEGSDYANEYYYGPTYDW